MEKLGGVGIDERSFVAALLWMTANDGVKLSGKTSRVERSGLWILPNSFPKILRSNIKLD
jgi:hypothetical protein